MIELEDKLREVCDKRDFCYHLSYSNAEGNYYAEAYGQGNGEWTEIKRASSLGQAIERLTKRVIEKFP